MAKRLRLALLLAAAPAVLTGPAGADDLREALTLAYNTNPSLQAARASQRATDESVPIARSAGLPSLSGTASYTHIVSGASLNGPDKILDLSANLGVPVYSGGAVKNSIRAAETRVMAGQADLRGTESAIFAAVVASYLDVIANEAIVGLRRKNVQVLGVNVQSTRDRFEIGDLTRTDVAQSQSRLAIARSGLEGAEASLAASRERYIQLVGKAPENLQPPPPLTGIPATAEEAVAIALDSNPDLIAARTRSKAAGYDSAGAGAGRLPRVSVFAGADRTDYLGSLGGGALNQVSTGAQVGVRASIPIFSGGLPAAQQRQARARESATIENEIAAEREVIATVRSAYTQWQAANAVIVSSQTAVDAASLSLEGVRAENSVGNRTILDILNAEQELLNAQVQLVSARRNAYVAGFNLLSAMGKAEARDLGLDGGALYDPQANYARVKGKVFDWDFDPAPTPKSTRTVDTRVQDGSIPPAK
ncbi:MAG: TolC family outer membrane protein [Novosphingobium sp.]